MELFKHHDAPAVTVPSRLFITVRTFLTSRVQPPTTDSVLSFETALEELLTLCEPVRPLELQSGWVSLAPKLVQDVTAVAVDIAQLIKQPSRRPSTPRGSLSLDPPSFRVEGAPLPRRPPPLTILENPVDLQSGGMTTGSDVTQLSSLRLVGDEPVEASASKPVSTAIKGAVPPSVGELLARPCLLFTGDFTLNAHGPAFSSQATLSTACPRLNTLLPFNTRFRATLVFNFQFYTASSTSGIVCICWQPTYGAWEGVNTDYMRWKTMACTHLPHVLIDLSRQTSATIRIPWFQATDSIAPGEALGTVAANVLARDVTGSTIKCSVFTHLEDVEAFGEKSVSTTSVSLQSGPLDEMTSEAQPLSHGLQKAAGLTSLLGRTALPAALPLSAVLNGSAKLAKAFGWSRPVIQDPPVKVVAGHYAANIDMPIASTPVCPFALAPSLPPPDSISGLDEMAFSHILRKPSIIYSGYISNTQISGVPVYVCPLTPSALWYRKIAGTPTRVQGNTFAPNPGGSGYLTFQPSSIFALSSLFALWRGSLTFRFTFATNIYTTGSVRVSYLRYNEPRHFTDISGVTNTLTVPPFNSPDAPSVSFNLRSDVSSFDVHVPFSSPTAFAEWEENTGGLVMYIEGPVSSTVAATTNIDFYVEVWSDDMQFAKFRGMTYMPTNSAVRFDKVAAFPTTSVVGGASVPTNFPPIPDDVSAQITLQSGSLEGTEQRGVLENLDGQLFTSLKQIAMIPQRVGCAYAATLTYPATSTASSDIFPVLPWFARVPICYYTNTTTGVKTSFAPNFTYGFTLCNFVSSFFAFARGGTNIEVHSTADTVSAGDYRVSDATLTSTSTKLGFNTSSAFSSNSFMASVTNRTLTNAPAAFTFKHPANTPWIACNRALYTNPSSLSVAARSLTDPLVKVVDGTSTVYPHGLLINSAATHKTWFTRCAADDAFATFYLGPPLFSAMHPSTLDSDFYVVPSL